MLLPPNEVFDVEGIRDDANVGVDVGLVPLSRVRDNDPFSFARTTFEPLVVLVRARFPPLIDQKSPLHPEFQVKDNLECEVA